MALDLLMGAAVLYAAYHLPTAVLLAPCTLKKPEPVITPKFKANGSIYMHLKGIDEQKKFRPFVYGAGRFSEETGPVDIGRIEGYELGSLCYIRRLHSAPETFSDRKLFAQLVRGFKEEIQSRGIKSIYTHVKNNKELVIIAKKQGFERIRTMGSAYGLAIPMVKKL